MPLFTAELNRVANGITASDLTVYLHTAAPTDAQPANGRVATGGGAYQNGATLAAADISDAVAGDMSNNNDIDFGAAAANVGRVTHASVYRGATPVGFTEITATTINSGQTFRIEAGTLQINLSST